MTDQSFAIGDILENEDGTTGKITSISEDGATLTIEWTAENGDVVVEEVPAEEINESAASETLHANSKSDSDPASKFEAITKMIGAMAAMSNEDCVKWFKETMAKGSYHGTGDNSASNAATLDMKPSNAVATKGPKTKDAMPKLSVKEDVDGLFAGQELSEDFRDKASTLFEAALEARVILETEKLEESYAERLAEEVAAIDEELNSKLTAYLDYAGEKWLEENRVELESSLRNEIIDDFIVGMKNLFSEHYVDIPEDKVDVVEELSTKVEELEERLDGAITESATLKDELANFHKAEAIRSMTEGLTVVQAERLTALAESVDFTGDVEQFSSKLNVIKEHYFAEKPATKTGTVLNEKVNDEVLNEGVKTAGGHVDSNVAQYAKLISRQSKAV